MSAYAIPIFGERSEPKRVPGDWLHALRPTKFEVYWRMPYEQRRADEKRRYYLANRKRILERKRKFRLKLRAAKGRK